MPTDIEETIEETAVDESTPEETPESEVAEAPTEDLQSKNIREMRLTKERAERERDEAYKLMQRMKSEQEALRKPEPQPEEDLDLGVADDDLVEGKHLGKIAREMRELKKQLKSYQQASTSATTEAKLKSKYSDFDKVVSKENVEALVRDYPELGDTLRANTDLYSQAVTAYTMIRQMGVYKEDNYTADRAKAEANAGKPRPLASVSPQQGDSPLTKANAFANGLTDELKAQLFKEMTDARSRI